MHGCLQNALKDRSILCVKVLEPAAAATAVIQHCFDRRGGFRDYFLPDIVSVLGDKTIPTSFKPTERKREIEKQKKIGLRGLQEILPSFSSSSSSVATATHSLYVQTW